MRIERRLIAAVAAATTTRDNAGGANKRPPAVSVGVAQQRRKPSPHYTPADGLSRRIMSAVRRPPAIRCLHVSPHSARTSYRFRVSEQDVRCSPVLRDRRAPVQLSGDPNGRVRTYLVMARPRLRSA